MKVTVSKIVTLMMLVFTLVGCGVSDISDGDGNINLPSSDTEVIEYKTESESEDSNLAEKVTLDPYVKLENCEFNSLDDTVHYMREYTGKPLVVHFWGPWCEPCLDEMVYFSELYEEYSDRVQFLMISTTDDKVGEGLMEYVDEYPFELYYSKEDKINPTYNLWNIPTTYFVNEQGFIIKSFEKKQDYATLRGYIEVLLEEV